MPEVKPSPTPEPVVEEAPVRKTIEQLIGKLEGIQFMTGKATIKDVSFATLDKIVTAMKERKTLKIRIEGHTDNVGKEQKNTKLSQARSEAVSQYLVEKGIEASRLEFKGFGPTQPIADNKTDEGRAKNRRVEFVIIQD